MRNTAVKPMNQKVRIAALRVFFVFALAAILFTRSGWVENSAASELFFESFETLGLLMVVAGVLGRFWAILYIGGHKNQQIMQVGPYSICRHPLYLFSTIGALGFGLMLGSFILAAVIGGGIFVVLSMTAAREEAFLRAEFGDRYDVCAARVPRIWPKPSLYETPRTAMFDAQTLRGNLSDAFVFLALIPLAEFIEFVHEFTGMATIPIW